MNKQQYTPLRLEILFDSIHKELLSKTRFKKTIHHQHHGLTSVNQHCLNVARMSYKIAHVLNLNTRYPELIRGALLHDYFLYDWHDISNSHKFHAFSHSLVAYNNACEELVLTSTEKDIILKHMFPLTLPPPLTIEGWLVCIVDKICSVMEILNLIWRSDAYVYQ